MANLSNLLGLHNWDVAYDNRSFFLLPLGHHKHHIKLPYLWFSHKCDHAISDWTCRFITLKCYPQVPSTFLQIEGFLSLNWNDTILDVFFFNLKVVWKWHSAEKTFSISRFHLFLCLRYVVVACRSAGNCSKVQLLLTWSSGWAASWQSQCVEHRTTVGEGWVCTLHFLKLLCIPIGRQGTL